MENVNLIASNLV